MRISVSLLLTSLFVCTVTPHASPVEPTGEIRISKLDVISDNLPEEDRQRLVSHFEHGEYPRDQIKTRVQGTVQRMGYILAVAEEPKMSFPTRGEQGVASVAIRVHEGALYRLADIHFLNAAQFPSSRIRPLFPLRQGAPFEGTAVGVGLDRLRALYVACGYKKVTIVPSLYLDEPSKTIDLTIDVSQGDRAPSHGCN
jgi:outer membrane protein assembly factor BamA